MPLNLYSLVKKEPLAKKNKEHQKTWWDKRTPEERKTIGIKKRERRRELHGDNYNHYPEWEEKNWHKKRAKSHQAGIKKNYPEKLLDSDFTESWLAEFIRTLPETPCVYCQRPCGCIDQGHVDHIVPLSKGGDHKKANLQACCKQCNMAKGGFTEKEFTDWILLFLNLRNFPKNIYSND